MSVTERGTAQLEQREREAEERRLYDIDQNRRTVAWWFRFTFLYRGAPEAVIEDWVPAEDGLHADSSFTVEGVRYRVEWEFRGRGGDRADWDDGWWPAWYVIVRRPRRLFPILMHDVEVSVWGAASVAEAVGSA